MEQAVGTSPSSIRKEREAKAELRFRTNDMKQENAVYRNSASSENNPLIDALPAPLGRDGLLATPAVENILPDNYQSLSPQARQELCSRLKEIYFPMDYTAEIYMAFYTGLLTAYMGRTKAVATKQLVELGKAIKYNQFAIVPDSPIQAECFAVVGEPGMGKTTTIKKILQLFPPVIYHSVYKGVAFHQIQIPYLFIQCPMNSSIKAVCYTDGSFDSADKWNPKSGFAAILLRGTPEAATWLGCIYGPCRKDPAIRNIGGELEAAEQAIRYAIEHGYKHIHIFHDYMGVGSWANGLWKTNRVDTGAYVQFIQKARRNIAISFTHIHGHSGLVYNELADAYAKAGSENSEIQYF